ncbi:MAG TPA: sn-glycerol-3-phosphate ABC transporter ATP-binding protein UgpC [Thermoanaerobaculia bacterium]|nr:sn-glycerol-3-phosphate ABC transporter ATP-binding protein UgpC [Thermoanaerobaculia bacterium]
MAGVRFENVSKRYGAVSVIEGLNLEIHDREFMVLVGPSGCGKSTALRMIAGLEDLSGGTIRIGDRAVNDLPPKDRDIAMVFQSYALYPHMTVRGNLEFGPKIRKQPKKEIDRLVEDAAEILGIAPLLDRKPRELSGGQRQRVAVGRAIVRQPSVFLFDEPLSNLDAKLRVQMRAEITKLQKRLETTCVYVTHDQVEAMTMGHRMAILNGGKLQQVGTPLEVYEKPANLFVANFIGTPPMNMLTGQIGADGTTLDLPGLSIPLPEHKRSAMKTSSGREIVLGIRPENVALAPAETKGPAAEIAGSVEVVEPLGHETTLHVRAADGMIVTSVEPGRAPRTGDTVSLNLELDSAHLFDGATGQRLG